MPKALAFLKLRKKIVLRIVFSDTRPPFRHSRWSSGQAYEKSSDPAKLLSRKRSIIETINDQLKNIVQKSDMMSKFTFLLHYPYDEPRDKDLEEPHNQIVKLLGQ